MSKGDIVLIPFPFTDLSGYKVRPALILWSEEKSEDCLVSFISSVNKKRLSNFDIRIQPSSSNGLKTVSVVKLNKIATLQKKILVGEIGKIKKEDLGVINSKLKKMLKI